MWFYAACLLRLSSAVRGWLNSICPLCWCLTSVEWTGVVWSFVCGGRLARWTSRVYIKIIVAIHRLKITQYRNLLTDCLDVFLRAFIEMYRCLSLHPKALYPKKIILLINRLFAIGQTWSHVPIDTTDLLISGRLLLNYWQDNNIRVYRWLCQFDFWCLSLETFDLFVFT